MSEELSSNPISRGMRTIGEELPEDSTHDVGAAALSPEDLYRGLSPSLRWYLERNHTDLLNELRDEAVQIIEIENPQEEQLAEAEVGDSQIEDIISSVEETALEVRQLEEVDPQYSPQSDQVELESEEAFEHDEIVEELSPKQVEKGEPEYPEGALVIQIGAGALDFTEIGAYLDQQLEDSEESVWILDLRKVSDVTPMLFGLLFSHQKKLSAVNKSMMLHFDCFESLSESYQNQIRKKFELYFPG